MRKIITAAAAVLMAAAAVTAATAAQASPRQSTPCSHYALVKAEPGGQGENLNDFAAHHQSTVDAIIGSMWRCSAFHTHAHTLWWWNSYVENEAYSNPMPVGERVYFWTYTSYRP